MRKFLIKWVSIIIVGSVVIYFASKPIIERASETGINYILQEVKMYDLEIERPWFQSAGISSFNAVSWNDVMVGMKVKKGGVFPSDQRISLRFNKLTVSVRNPFDRSFVLTLKGIRSTTSDASGEAYGGTQGEQISGGKLSIPFRLSSFTGEAVRAQTKMLCYSIIGFVTQGRTSMSSDFSGSTTFYVSGKAIKVKLKMGYEGGVSSLVMDKSELRKVALQFGEELTNAETELLSRNPMRAPDLLRIGTYARRAAKEESERNSAVPEDAYKHVLWSYLLTKAYGAMFAKKVTDAHEDVIRYSEADRAKDKHNLAIGRRYAESNYPESDILNRVMTDPDIRR